MFTNSKTIQRFDLGTRILASLFLLLFCPRGFGHSEERIAGAVSIPITVQEALIQNHSGYERVNEPVTLGIPLRDDDGISDISQLGVTNVDAFQFRVLSRYRSGNIQWVLVDFQTSLSAGAIENNKRLVAGSGTFGGPDLATESTDAITVNTGPMQVTISKREFRLFDRVVLSGKEVVSPSTSSDIRLIKEDGSLYLASNDSDVQVALEENGPVRCVVKAEGSHVGSDGLKYMDYTVRLHFYKHSSKVRAFYTLRNANRFSVSHKSFKSLSVRVGTNLNFPEYRIAGSRGELTGNLGAGDSVYIYQAKSDFPQSSPPPFNQEGYWIKQNGMVLDQGGVGEYPEVAYADISNSAGTGLTFAVRFMAGWWPKSLEIFGNGNIEIGLWPKFFENGFNGDDLRWSRFSSHTTYEMLFSFHGEGNEPAGEAGRFQYPLVAKLDVEDYNRSEQIFGKIVSFQDEADYYRSNGWPYDGGGRYTLTRRPKLKVWRFQNWGEPGGLNGFDFAKISLINFLREERHFAGEYFLYAEQRFRYNCDWATYHSDNFDPSLNDVPELQNRFGDPISMPEENSDKLWAKGAIIFQLEHRHWYGMTLFYYLTGDERFRDSILDWGEYMKREIATNGHWPRATSWNLFSAVELYRFTGEPTYLDIALGYADDRILSTDEEEGVSFGFNRKRGYYLNLRAFASNDRRISSFVHGGMLHDALYYLYKTIGHEHAMADDFLDVLEGLARFSYHENWVERDSYDSRQEGYVEDAGYPGFYELDVGQNFDSLRLWVQQIFFAHVNGYEVTNDTRYRDRINQYLQKVAWDWGSVYWYHDFPGIQEMIYLMTHNTEYSTWQDVAVEATKQNDGSYRLSWIVPSGAQAIRIKHSSKPIVDWLGFDRKTRNYAYDPSDYTPFFSAANMPNEPEPLAAGEHQSFTVSGLPGSTSHYFAVRILAKAEDITTDTDDNFEGSSLRDFYLEQNYPNPFNPDTQFVFTVPKFDPENHLVSLTIFNILGERVRKLINGHLFPGRHVVTWDGRDDTGRRVSSGTYLYKLRVGSLSQTRKMLLLK